MVRPMGMLSAKEKASELNAFRAAVGELEAVVTHAIPVVEGRVGMDNTSDFGSLEASSLHG